MIDAEAITVAYLDGVLDAAVVPETPDDTSEPWVKVIQIDSNQISGMDADVFNVHYLQLDCYPSGDGTEYQEEAANLFIETRAALRAMPDATHDDAVVTAVRFSSSRRLPDEEFEPPRQRYIIQASVYGHAD